MKETERKMLNDEELDKVAGGAIKGELLRRIIHTLKDQSEPKAEQMEEIMETKAYPLIACIRG